MHAGLASPAPSRTFVELPLFPSRVAWTVTLDDTLAGTPSFDASRGYFPMSDGTLDAYDLRTGSRVWRAPFPARSPIASGERRLYAAHDGALSAFSDTDGSLVWRTALEEPLGTTLVWDTGWLFAATTTGALVALRASDGHVIWRRDMGAPLSAPPAMAANRLYAPLEDHRIVALAVEDGALVWERRIGGPPNDLLALDDRLYFGSDDDHFYCLLSSSGFVDWRWPVGVDVVGLPAHDDDRVYFVGLDNLLRAVSRRSGNQAWKRPLPMRPASGPIRVGNVLLVRGVGPTVLAYQLNTGAPAGELATTGDVVAPPVVVAGTALPMVAVLTRDLQGTTVVTAFTRAIEPALVPVAPLPNPVVPVLPR